MRARVESLITAFLTETWTSATQSITINGIDASSLPCVCATPGPAAVEYTYTPYDHSLQKRVAALHAELEALTTQVSRLRREAPGRGAQMYGACLEEALAEEEEEEERVVGERGQGGEGEDMLGLDLDLDLVGGEETSAMYERGLAELRRLGGDGSGSGSLTETVGKVQRAWAVATELE